MRCVSTSFQMRTRWTPEHGHSPCEWCGGPVIRQPGQTEIGWKRSAYCCYECQRHRVYQLEHGQIAYSHKPRQIAPWPEIPTYTNTPDPGDGVVMRYDTPVRYYGTGTAAGQCADDADSEF